MYAGRVGQALRDFTRQTRQTGRMKPTLSTGHAYRQSDGPRAELWRGAEKVKRFDAI